VMRKAALRMSRENSRIWVPHGMSFKARQLDVLAEIWAVAAPDRLVR
jgi:hypothetical protein